MTRKIINLLFSFFVASFGLLYFNSPGFSQTPTITVRLANPQNDCITEEYCLDVEFRSDTLDQEIFGMNIRFFYDDDVLELVNFRDFQGGYSPVDPDPPVISTSVPAGPSLFNFEGAAEFVNGAMQLTNINAPPIILDTGAWTKLFQICFLVDDINANLDTFCPSVVWDLEQDPGNGGFLSGDDGVVVTVVGANEESAPSFESVVQFNWEYIGNGSPPYGQPVDSTCSNINCTLPLTLLSFFGISEDEGNLIQWRTIDEIDVEGFDIQRSSDGFHWKSLGFIKGSGTSANQNDYRFMDHQPGWDVNFYRLQLRDQDGNFKYSAVIKMATPFQEGDNTGRLIVYPNPVKTGSLSIYVSGIKDEQAIIRLYNLTGQLVMEEVMNQSDILMDVRDLSSGIYMVSMTSENENICKKIIIQ